MAAPKRASSSASTTLIRKEIDQPTTGSNATGRHLPTPNPRAPGKPDYHVLIGQGDKRLFVGANELPTRARARERASSGQITRIELWIR
jgi:hypothetical protein